MWERIPEFYQDAKEQECAFRLVLKDLPERLFFVPTDFNPDLPLEEFLKRYSPEEPYARNGKFCITDFKKGPDESLGLSQTDLMIVAANIAGLSGMGAVLKYGTDSDGSVSYSGQIMSWRG